MNKPNVVFIIADDLGYGDIALFGNSILRTPHLDELGRQGAVLTQHYSASPLCAPARAALLTGRYNHRTGAVDVPSNRGLDRIALREHTMADIFAGAGYTTGLVGKWHNGLHDMRFHPNSRGFHEFAGFLNGGMDYYDWVLDRNGQAENNDGRYLTDVFTEEAIGFVQRNRNTPFMLHVAYNAPHTPLQAPEDEIGKYRGKPGINEQVSILYAMIERMDTGIGRIIEEIERQGLSRNTIIVFTSDNGPQLNSGMDRYNGPFRGSKGNALEGGIRVPAIIAGADFIPGGTEIHEMIHFCDWLPTLACLCNIELPGEPELDGWNMAGRLRGEPCDVPDVRFWQRNRYEPVARCNAAMRDGPWKLVWPMRNGADGKEQIDNTFYQDGLTSAHRLMNIDPTLPQRDISATGSPLLFNLKDDPHEDNDLSSRHPERIAAMTREWDNWFDDVYAEWRAAYDANMAG